MQIIWQFCYINNRPIPVIGVLFTAFSALRLCNPLSKSRNLVEVSYKKLRNSRKIAARLGLEFCSKLGLVLGLWGNQTIAPEEKCPLLGLGFAIGLVLGLGSNFPQVNFPRTVRKTPVPEHIFSIGIA